jgi:hypothetical protein
MQHNQQLTPDDPGKHRGAMAHAKVRFPEDDCERRTALFRRAQCRLGILPPGLSTGYARGQDAPLGEPGGTSYEERVNS